MGLGGATHNAAAQGAVPTAPGTANAQHMSPPPGAPLQVPQGSTIGAPGSVAAGTTAVTGQPSYDDPNVAAAAAAATGGYVYYTPYPYPGVSLFLTPMNGANSICCRCLDDPGRTTSTRRIHASSVYASDPLPAKYGSS